MIHKAAIQGIVDRIVEGYDPEKIILFGSYAEGNPDDNSDVDLLVVKETDKPRPERVVEARRFVYGASVPLDLIVYTPEEIESEKRNKLGFIFRVLNNGKTIYERSA